MTAGKLAVLVLSVAAAASAAAADLSPAALHSLRTQQSRLPPLGPAWAAENPYRDNPAVVAVGRALYREACARCHGDESAKGMPAPDLRRLDRYCRRITETQTYLHCKSDVDDYFRRSVLFGKFRLGIEHMPAWQDVFTQEGVWAIRSYVESRTAPAK